MATVEVDPISRIEGHLGIKLTVSATGGGTGVTVTDADAHGNLWRGFENFLLGREPNDAITFVQRICGVCPIPHATASTFAIDAVLGYSDGYITFNDEDDDGLGVPKKAVHVRNLVYASEFLMSHITHFYHLVALSYVQGPPVAPWTPYFADGGITKGTGSSDDWYHPMLKNPDPTGLSHPLPTGDRLWDAVVRQYVKALRIRRLTFEAGALFAGRMPMTSSFVAGGVTLQDTATLFQTKCEKFYNLISEVGIFIVREHVPLVLALGALYPEYDNTTNAAKLSKTGGIGAGLGNFLAWGAFPNGEDNILAIKGGYVVNATVNDPTIFITGKSNVSTALAAVAANLVEDVAHSRYEPSTDWGYVSGQSWQRPCDVTRTEPKRDGGDTNYSWIKAPRWKYATGDGGDGKYYAMEVGPFARMVVNGNYPVDGSPLAGNVPGYTAYASGAVLDKRMVSEDLVAALISEETNFPYPGFVDLVCDTWILGLNGGLSTMDRLRARALEALVLVQEMIGAYHKPTVPSDANPGTFGGGSASAAGSGWIKAAYDAAGGDSYNAKGVPLTRVQGCGVSEAPRGGLAHFATIDKGKLVAYQCVVPTTWNASPKDSQTTAFDTSNSGRGPIEQACYGSPYAGGETPGVEALRIAQSFDPCIACAVH